MPVLSNAQVATLQKVLAVTNNVLPRLEMLESLSKINISMGPRVQELRSQREYLAQLATAALEIERQLGTAITVPPVSASSGMVSYSPPPMSYSPPPPPPPASAPLYMAPMATNTPTQESGGYPTGYRRFIRRDPAVGDDEQRMYLAQGWRVEYEPETGWWSVRI